jgi:hypothetical protein
VVLSSIEFWWTDRCLHRGDTSLKGDMTLMSKSSVMRTTCKAFPGGCVQYIVLSSSILLDLFLMNVFLQATFTYSF